MVAVQSAAESSTSEFILQLSMWLRMNIGFKEFKQTSMRQVVVLTLAIWCLTAAADDDIPASTAAVAAPNVIVEHGADTTQDTVQFTTDAQWEIAGYNMEEIIYTILITSHDTRILRCRTQVQGHYLENGKLLNISDQQTTTVFPDQQARVGNWTGLDKDSGATFTVKCRVLQN